MSKGPRLRPIAELAGELGISDSELFLYGPYKAKVSLRLLERLRPHARAKYVAVSAITPTPLGEGKTVHTIGVSLALNRLGRRAICTLRQPSMGPVFGIKGGATGGGLSRILPAEEINLHLTGDFHAVAIAHNLLAAALDNSLYHGNPLRIDPARVGWKRVVDINDRALRRVRVGLGGPKAGVPRDSGFEITAASELMSILALATGLEDLRARIGRIVPAEDEAGNPLTAERLEAAGAMAALLRETLQPTLLQTSEGTAAFLHAGPFANIGPGNSSILADQVALRLADFVVTEAGFAADMGLEKLFNIKCRAGGLQPDAVVMVASVRALKMHSGRFEVKPGRPLDPGLFREDVESLALGMANLEQQIAVVRLHGVPVVVAVNVFGGETERELTLVREEALAFGAEAAVESRVFAKGGEGGLELAEAVVKAASKRSSFRFLYPEDLSVRKKIELLATRLYGAGSISYEPGVEETIDRWEERGWGKLPICMAKTQLSLSHDPNLKGAPRGYVFPIQEIRAMVGAGFLVPLAGEITTMPGFGSDPAYRKVDLDAEGHVRGL